MELKVVRAWSNDNETIGVATITHIEQCWILEDQFQTKKVFGQTRIPAGKYKIGVRTSNSSMNEDYKKRFPEMHRGMLEILNVPNFTNVYIHIGNDDADTSGCLLTGRVALIKDGTITTERSTEAYKDLYIKVINEAIAGNLTIHIINLM